MLLENDEMKCSDIEIDILSFEKGVFKTAGTDKLHFFYFEMTLSMRLKPFAGCPVKRMFEIFRVYCKSTTLEIARNYRICLILCVRKINYDDR